MAALPSLPKVMGKERERGGERERERQREREREREREGETVCISSFLSLRPLTPHPFIPSPPHPSPPTELYLLYAKLEEEHGLSRHAMAVYDRATKAVPADEQLEVG